MEKIYLISGMGADERVFKNLQFRNYEKVTVKWEKPLRNESLHDYCKRLLPQIDTPNPTIAGLSFGGMVANEITKLIPVKQVILISSLRSRAEMPWYFKFLGATGLHKLTPWGIITHMSNFLKYYFQVNEKEHMRVLLDMAKDADISFLHWVAHAAVNWHGEEIPGTKQIHGDIDRTLPIRYLKHPDKVLHGTGHAMVLQRAKEVSEFIDSVALASL